MPPVVRRGEPVCPGREAGRRASAAGPWMAHRRVPWDKRVNRGNPTQEGEQAGVAFLLVTFLWPRKEKSLAQARRAGETPSRATPSCPAWRSHANTLLQGNDVTDPLTPALSPKGRGDCYRGRLRFANRPYSTLLAKPCQRGWRPLNHPLSRWGEGTVIADDYASLIDPTRPDSTLLVPGPSETPSRVEPSHLAEARDAGLASANDATAPGSRYHNAPLTLAYEKGSNGHPPPSYGADGARSTDIADSSVRIDRFFALVQSYGRTPGVGPQA